MICYCWICLLPSFYLPAISYSNQFLLAIAPSRLWQVSDLSFHFRSYACVANNKIVINTCISYVYTITLYIIISYCPFSYVITISILAYFSIISCTPAFYAFIWYVIKMLVLIHPLLFLFVTVLSMMRCVAIFNRYIFNGFIGFPYYFHNSADYSIYFYDLIFGGVFLNHVCVKQFIGMGA